MWCLLCGTGRSGLDRQSAPAVPPGIETPGIDRTIPAGRLRGGVPPHVSPSAPRASMVDHEEFARGVLGMPRNESGIPALSLDGVTGAQPRPCVGCDAPTDRITFDPDTLLPEAPRCARCAEADWDVRVELAQE